MQITDIKTSEFRTNELSDAVQRISSDDIKACLQSDDCSSAFLHEIFFWHSSIDEQVRASVLDHVNCPDWPLLFALKYFPEWAEDSTALSIKKMAELGGGTDPQWEKLKSNYMRRSFEYEYDDWSVQFQNKRKYTNLETFVALWPSSFLEEMLARIDIKGVKAIASIARDNRVVDIFVNHKEYRVRRVAADLLPVEQAVQMVNDSSIGVRKTLAKRCKLPTDTIKILANDKSESVRDVLTATHSARLPTKKVPLNKGSNEEYDADAIKDTLMFLRNRKLNESELLKFAEHPSAIVRYAAALHKQAYHGVHEILMKKPTDWACAPVASRTQNPEYLAALAQSEHLDVQRHLAHNRNLDKSIALELLDRVEDNDVRLGIAATFVTDNDVVEKIISSQAKNSLWELALREATNPGTKATKLREIYYESPALCVSRAIALHPNCPTHQASIFGCYLQNDIKANPKYALRLLENKKLPYYEYSDWSFKNRMKEQTAPAFLSNRAAKRKDVEFSRGAANCPSVNAHCLDYAVLNGDQTTYKRLLDVNAKKLGRFTQDVLSLTTPAIKKTLIKKTKLHVDTIKRLADDKDKSVRVAIGNSTQGKKAGAKSEHTDAQGNLGNKAARLELAETSKDIQILARLCADKLPAVRQQAVSNRKAPIDSQLPLLCDASSEVVESALGAIGRKTLTEQENLIKQKMLSTALHNAKDYTKDLAAVIIRQIESVKIVEDAYMMGRLAGLEGSVAKRVESEAVFKALLSQASQQGPGNSRWCAELACYRGTSLNDFNEIIKYSRQYSRPLLKVRSADLLIDVIEAKGWNWVKQSDCAYPIKVEFSKEQVDRLLAIAPEAIVCLGKSSNVLKKNQLIEQFEGMNSKDKLELIRHVEISSPEFKQHVFEWCCESYKSEDDKYESSLALFFELQEPIKDQIDFALKSKDVHIRTSLARNPLVQGKALPVLAKDNKTEVRECLFYRGEGDDVEEGDEYVENWGGEFLPDDVILILASDSNRYIKARARKILTLRGIELTQVRSNVTSNISSLLKKHEAPFGAVKANKKLLELGVLETGQRESTSKPGVVREFKKLSEDGQKYGVNKYSEYGDATPEYFVDLFPALLKKIA